MHPAARATAATPTATLHDERLVGATVVGTTGVGGTSVAGAPVVVGSSVALGALVVAEPGAGGVAASISRAPESGGSALAVPTRSPGWALAASAMTFDVWYEVPLSFGCR